MPSLRLLFFVPPLRTQPLVLLYAAGLRSWTFLLFAAKLIRTTDYSSNGWLCWTETTRRPSRPSVSRRARTTTQQPGRFGWGEAAPPFGFSVRTPGRPTTAVMGGIKVSRNLAKFHVGGAGLPAASIRSSPAGSCTQPGGRGQRRPRFRPDPHVCIHIIVPTRLGSSIWLLLLSSSLHIYI